MNCIVDAAWLTANLGRPDLVVLDSSWHMPAAGRDPRAEFSLKRIPAARFFDIDHDFADPGSELPHMLPSPDRFRVSAQLLGLTHDAHIICYDSVGIFSSPRCWWTLRAFGFQNVAVLDGGLPAWIAAGGDIETGAEDSVIESVLPDQTQPSRVCSARTLHMLLGSGDVVILDARSEERYRGDVEEPRAGLRRGHIPGAENVPFDRLISGGRLLNPNKLRPIFADAGVRTDSRVIAYCGSGVTAAIIALAIEYSLGNRVEVFDGSWAEWGDINRTELPVSEKSA